MQKRKLKIAPKIQEQSVRKKTPTEIFNELGIRFKVCPIYQPKLNSIIDTDCKCNRPKHHVEFKEFLNSNVQDYDHFATVKVHTDSVYYSDGEYKYVRLALDTSEQKIERILFDVWGIFKPQLIISIIGDKEYFPLTDRLEKNIIEELIGIVCQSDVWLFTDGYNGGIVHLVGQAINKIRMTKCSQNAIAIGMCKWGSFKNFDNIKKNIEQSTRQAVDEYEEDISTHEPHDLELNHSHYLMLDDGRIRNDSTQDFRTRFAVHISKLNESDNFPIPVVSIVFKGGVEAIENIYYDLQARIPIILIGGTGGIADFFKRWLLYTRHIRDTVSEKSKIPWNLYEKKREKLPSTPSANISHINIKVDSTSEEYLSEMFKTYAKEIKNDLENTIYFHESKPNEFEQIIDRLLLKIKYCLQPTVRDNIQVFNLTPDNHLTETIFRSICQSRIKYSTRQNDNRLQAIEKECVQQNQKQPELVPIKKIMREQACNKIYERDTYATRAQLLQLAMDWNMIDVTKELVFKNSLDFIVDQKIVLLRAVTLNLPMFVYELLKLGLNLTTIFPTNDRHNYILINDFYTDELVSSDKTHLKEFIRNESKQIRFAKTLNDVLFDLIGNYMHKLYFDDPEDENKYRVEHGFPSCTTASNSTPSSTLLTHNDYIMRDLFLWSILINRIDIAKVFLSFMKYRICPALIATTVFKNYSKKAPYGDLKKEYDENANYFQQYAVRCLDCCDDDYTNESCEIILQSLELYGYVTCVQVAAEADAKEFLATSCCAQTVRLIWYDKLNSEDSWKNKLRLLFNIMTFGLLTYFFDTFQVITHDKKNAQPDYSHPILNRHGIGYPDLNFLETNKYFNHNEVVSCIRKVTQFHRSPCVKYVYHLCTHLFFLLLFSYVLLFKFSPPSDRTPSIDGAEIVTIILVICMFVEEIRYILNLENCTAGGKISHYMRSFFKILTLLGFLFFIIGLILRFIKHNEDEFIVARIIMAIDLEIWWIRLLSFAACLPMFGPHLYAMGKMLKELFYFLGILGVVICGYGVASRSMYFYQIENNLTTARNGTYDTKFDGRNIFRQVIYPVYYFLHGEIGGELEDLDQNPDASSSIITHILLAFHVMFVNILLLNLLIAIFSKRYDDVYNQAEQIWHSQRYVFVREYFLRSPLFPPISFFYDIYYICVKIFHGFKFCNGKRIKYKPKQFKMISKNIESMKRWVSIEGSCTYQYAHDEVKALNKRSTGTKLRDDDDDDSSKTGYYKQIQDDISRLEASFERIKEDFSRTTECFNEEITRLLEAKQ